jgi:hypothetical protein
MKKQIITILAVSSLAVDAYAQGMVSLMDTAVAVSTNMVSVGGTQGGLYQPAGTYYFEMLFIPNTGQAAPTYNGGSISAWTDSTLSGTNTGNGVPTAAYLGHITGENGAAGIAVPGWLSGSSAYFVVLGWSANEGTWGTVEQVLNGTGSWLTLGPAGGLFGYSAVGYAVSAAAPVPGTILFGTAPGLINTLILGIPEPSTLALAGLGGLSLLLMRRLK